jgi:hypothetical protein
VSAFIPQPRDYGATALKAFGAGAEGIRTPDPHNAIVVLYQLSYDPKAISDCRLPSADCNWQLTIANSAITPCLADSFLYHRLTSGLNAVAFVSIASGHHGADESGKMGAHHSVAAENGLR